MDNYATETGRVTHEVFRTLRHELRTPINHIIGYSELLLDEAGDFGRSDVIGDLQRIHAGGKELLRLVGGFLDPGKVDAGDIELERMCHELRTPLNAIIGYSDLLQENAEDGSLNALVPDLQRIHAAGRHLLSLVNAAADLARLDVAALAGAPERTALPDSGSEDVSPGAGVVEVSAPSPSACSGFLLVVDDNESNRDMLSRRLARLGYTVSLAEHGREALARLKQEPFDLVLLDIMMPEMNGYEVLQQMKADDALRHVPVIVLSAIDETDSAVRCIALGAEDYLPKPFDPVLLRARIGASLEKKRLRDQEALYLRQIEQERKRADELLHVILPDEVVDELKATNEVKPRRHENVAVLFCDIAGFTAYCDRREPHEVIPNLQRLVEAYEEIALRHGLEKIKTIGDSFMAAAGLLRPTANPVLSCVRCGVEMIAATQGLPPGWDVRIGISVGPVVAGVLGRRQYLFDIFGDTVNTAARMESHGIAGAITLSGPAWQQVAGQCYGESLGVVQVKGKGGLEMFRFGGFRA